MLVFIDFEASSLSKHSYPIEVGWVFADGTSEAHLIRPATAWTDWDMAAQAVHGIARADLLAAGRCHALVAQRMVEALAGHDLCASAPSWDGKWLSALLRAAGFSRHSLRLRGTHDVLREAAQAILAPVLAPDALDEAVAQLLALADVRERAAPPAHRALADAEQERQRWLAVTLAAEAAAQRVADPGRQQA